MDESNDASFVSLRYAVACLQDMPSYFPSILDKPKQT